MSKTAIVLGILCLVLAAVILVFADGLRRWYSGGFFALMGVVMLVNARRWQGIAARQKGP
jgi:hypothetical protein